MLCTHTASLTQGGLLLWNALTFFPLRQKVLKQMLLQKKKNAAASWATALLTPNFHKKKRERERTLSTPALLPGTHLHNLRCPAHNRSKGQGSTLGPVGRAPPPQWLAWTVPHPEAGLRETGEEGKAQEELLPEASRLGLL